MFESLAWVAPQLLLVGKNTDVPHTYIYIFTTSPSFILNVLLSATTNRGVLEARLSLLLYSLHSICVSALFKNINQWSHHHSKFFCPQGAQGQVVLKLVANWAAGVAAAGRGGFAAHRKIFHYSGYERPHFTPLPPPRTPPLCRIVFLISPPGGVRGRKRPEGVEWWLRYTEKRGGRLIVRKWQQQQSITPKRLQWTRASNLTARRRAGRPWPMRGCCEKSGRALSIRPFGWVAKVHRNRRFPFGLIITKLIIFVYLLGRH